MLLGCCLGLGVITTSPAGAAWHLTYEAVGDDAPRHTYFVVRPDAVEWLDEQRRTLWRFERRSRVLVRFDPSQDSRETIDDTAIAAIADGLARAGVLGLGRGFARPWAALEAADRWTPLPAPAAAPIAACRRLALHAATGPVGETCIAEPDTLPSGLALMQLLLALSDLADALRRRLPDAMPADWPLHPLVVAARTGGLPLSVIEHLPGERRREWRLAGRPSTDFMR